MSDHTYKKGEKVVFKGKTYDFGYYSNSEGYVVLYEEGECNMQDSFAVKENRIYPKDAPWLEDRKILNIESQICDSEAAAMYLEALIKVAAEAGYTHVYDNWGMNAWDEYDIDTALVKFARPADKYNGYDENELPF